ncbi:MAG: DNA-binding response regulator [Alistipes sp.]|nr:DNA-binding response regulator [Alistipes sp.]
MQRVLIASDDEFARELIRLALSGVEAEVRCCGCGAEVERLCGRVLFDLVIVLRTAPFFCGRGLIGRLRPDRLRRPVVYVVSWQQSEQTVLSLLECGVDQYLTFPVSLQRLRSKVVNELCSVR